jgi:hypothetical protein
MIQPNLFLGEIEGDASRLWRIPRDFRDDREYRPAFRIVGKAGGLPGWTVRWNTHSARSEASGATVTGKGGNDNGQGCHKGLYYRKLRRRSLTDAMAALGLFVTKKRVSGSFLYLRARRKIIFAILVGYAYPESI